MDKKYTIEQLRAAWGAGKYAQKKDLPAYENTSTASIETQTVDLLYDMLVRFWFFARWLNGDYEPSHPMETDIDFLIWLARPALSKFEDTELATHHKERMERFWTAVNKIIEEEGIPTSSA